MYLGCWHSEPVKARQRPAARPEPVRWTVSPRGCLGWVALLVGAALAYCTVINPSLRTIVVYRTGIPELQRWAIGLLDAGEHGDIPRSAWPPELRDEAIAVDVISASHSQGAHVRISGGDMFLHVEILVGPPGFVPYPDDTATLERLADGVYQRLSP